MGPVAYKLHLPASSLIHPVIHVSQLKKALPPNTTISCDADLHLLSQFQDLTADRVLECRLQLVGQHVVPMELIQRAGCPQHCATWERQPLPRQTATTSSRRRLCRRLSTPSLGAARGRVAS